MNESKSKVLQTDNETTLAQLKQEVAHFVTEREWDQFHAPKNLSMAIAVEAAELMEKFLWIDLSESRQEVERNRQEIEDEVADVFIALLAFCNATGIDLAQACRNKLEKTGQKYPVEKARGKYYKYTVYKKD